MATQSLAPSVSGRLNERDDLQTTVDVAFSRPARDGQT